ncbi:hypothetical protein [Nocardia sp. NPDC019395]|uniref:hypothetical protein n=1 Tax=Nocardia sp. NPDC019395 TaxID=3154686 RepID=UPI0033F43ED6
MSARTELVRELNGPTAASEMLSEQEMEDLLGLFRDTQKMEKELLIEAVNGMIRFFPPPFKAITRRIMFGGLLEG